MSENDAVVSEMIEFVTGTAAPDWFGPRLFGGFVVGQLAYRAAVDAPPGKRLTSLHGHFVRAMRAGVPVSYATSDVKDGRTVCLRSIESSQEGAAVFRATCSFMADADGGYEYEVPPVEVPPAPDTVEGWSDGPRPFDNRWLGPTPQRDDGTYALSHRAWIKVAAPFDGDLALHTGLLAYMTDFTGPGARPLRLEPDIDGIVSLDHAIWFHRPPRADAWHYFEVECSLNHGGRSMLRGTFRDESMALVASVAQELIVTPT